MIGMEEARDRFFAKVNKTESCWFWTGVIKKGYGRIKINCKRYPTHRVSWLLAGHTIPEGHLIRHKCRNRHCVNPEHLETGTIAENNGPDRTRDGTTLIGNKNHMTKLTEEQVRAIRARHTEPKNILAEEFRVVKTTISNIIHRRTWKHLE